MSSASISTASTATTAGQMTFGSFVSLIGRWMRQNIPQVLVTALIGAAIGWLVNLYMLVVRYEGFYLPTDGEQRVDGSANLVTGQGNVMWGAIAWGVISTVAFGLVGYWRKVGTEQFLYDLSHLPDRFSRLLRTHGRQAWSAILWGVATSMLVSHVISPWLGVVVAGACFVSASSLVGRILSGLVLRLWSSVLQLASPTRRIKFEGGDMVILGMLGSSAALGIVFLMPNQIPGLRTMALIAAMIGALVLNIAPRSTLPMLMWLAAITWLGDLLFPPELWADDGGWVEAGGTLRGWATSPGAGTVTAYAGAGGVAAGAGAAVGNAIGQVIGQQGSGPLTNPWTGQPLTTWEQGKFGPGDNGEEGKPGQIWWGGNWLDPDEVRRRIEDSLEADRRREADSRQFQEESRRLREEAMRRRQQELEAEAAREQAARDEAERRAAAVDRASHDLTDAQRKAAEQIMPGINWSNPSPDDLERLRRLTGAIGNLRQGKSELEGAIAESDAAAADLGHDVARGVREIGQAAGETAEGILTGGRTRGAITSFVFGAAEAAGEGKGPGEAITNGLRDARDGLITNLGFGALGRAGVPMPTGPLGQTALGGAMAAGSAALQGAEAQDILKEGLYGGLGAAAGSGFERAATGGQGPDVHHDGPHQPADPGTTGHPDGHKKGPPDDSPLGHDTTPHDPDTQRPPDMDEARKRQAQEEARQRQEAEEAQRRQEVEETRKRREAEETRQRGLEEEQRRREVEEARKRQEAEEARRRQEADEERKRQEAEAAKQRLEVEESRKRQEAENERKRHEEEARKQLEAEETRKKQEAEEQRQRQEFEANRRQQAEGERQRQEAEARKQQEAENARQQAEEARRRRNEAEAERQRRQLEEQKELQEQQQKEQGQKQPQQQQQGIDLRTERIRQVHDYLKTHSQEYAHNYINMDSRRLMSATNSGFLSPGIEHTVHATDSGVGPAGYTFDSTQVVRIPQTNVVAASYSRNGVYYDSRNRPIDLRANSDKVLTRPNDEGTGVNVFYVKPNGTLSPDIPTRFLERWDTNTNSFVPVRP